MIQKDLNSVFTSDVLENLFPKEKANQFFEALFGDSKDGAYDISLKFKKNTENELKFEFHLIQRPGKCLACNLTYGLPQVFLRHPVINLKGLVQEIEKLLNKSDKKAKCTDWKLGRTYEISRSLHVIPFLISINS